MTQKQPRVKEMITGLFALLFVFMAHGSHAQVRDSQASEVLHNMRDKYEASISNVDEYIMITDMYTIRYQKAFDNDGRPYFTSRIEEGGLGLFASDTQFSDNQMFQGEAFAEAMQNAVYQGRETLDGHQVHVLYMEQMEDFVQAGENMDETMDDVRIYVDTDSYVLRQITFNVEAALEDRPVQELSPTILFQDYRNIEGMLVPFETLVVVEGLSAHLTDDERREAESSLMELERELEQMPANQREMLERMMGQQLSSLREMLEEDRMEIRSVVREVIVNPDH